MAVSAESAAKVICSIGGWQLTNLQLQKLLYLAQMIFIGKSKGEPLIRERFEAWDYGPVVPKIYRRAKMFGSLPVKNVFFDAIKINGTKEEEIIKKACNAFLPLGPSELVSITHWEDGAWAKHYKPGIKGITIPNEDILAEYRDRMNA